jgi:hypothetical protein
MFMGDGDEERCSESVLGSLWREMLGATSIVMMQNAGRGAEFIETGKEASSEQKLTCTLVRC